MNYSTDKSSAFSQHLSQALRKPSEPIALINAAADVLPFQSALCMINRKHDMPIHLCDTYEGNAAKHAIKYYAQSTYLINPVYNVFLNGLDSGLYRMRDLAPDHWDKNIPQVNLNMEVDSAEEIGFLTHDWPANLEELVIVHRVSSDVMVEISFAQPTTLGGFTDQIIHDFQAFVPLFMVALEAIFAKTINSQPSSNRLAVQLETFARKHLTRRENEVIQQILKGHSGKSICLNLGISMPTVKSHRKNAYAKLGIATQQELFNKFMLWKHQVDNS